MRKFFSRKQTPEVTGNFSDPEVTKVAALLGVSSEEELYRNYVSIGGEAGALVVAREVTKQECHWLDEDIKAGELVYRFTLPTYGSCDLDVSLPVSREPDQYPFFELPRDALLGDVDQA